MSNTLDTSRQLRLNTLLDYSKKIYKDMLHFLSSVNRYLFFSEYR